MRDPVNMLIDHSKKMCNVINFSLQATLRMQQMLPAQPQRPQQPWRTVANLIQTRKATPRQSQQPRKIIP